MLIALGICVKYPRGPTSILIEPPLVFGLVPFVTFVSCVRTAEGGSVNRYRCFQTPVTTANITGYKKGLSRKLGGRKSRLSSYIPHEP